jgi:mono/diheme cytochrome c family protein
MLKATVRAIGALLVAAALAAALPALGQSDQMAQGEQLFEQNCAACHQADGTGAPPAFPALAGNENLEDLELIVGNIHEGKGAMPPFPNLTAAQIAAVATYIRNSWGNAFGEVTTEEVAGILGEVEGAGDQATIWDGVYTEEQAARGKEAYGSCTRCHGRRLNGAADDPDMKSTPPLARAAFLRDWDGRSLEVLFEMIRATMPQNNPASLSDQAYIDIIAYMLSVSDAPTGDAELPPDAAALRSIVIEPKP